MNKVAITTRSVTNNRDGANTNETVLTSDAVKAKGLVRKYTAQTWGDARGCEGQPLIQPNVKLKDGTTRDLILAANMANNVYAFDVVDGREIWSVNLGLPITGSRAIDAYLINENWGVLSTPVSDGTYIYVLAWVSRDRTAANSDFYIHKINIATGEIAQKLNIDYAIYEPGHGLPTQHFNSAARKQRSSLAFDSKRGIVYAAFGTIAETSSTAQGWVLAINVTGTLSVKGAWASTARGWGAGIWMAGQGLAIDTKGDLYGMTGNGSFDGITDFGECFFKLSWVNNKLTCVDHWSPFSDAGREGKDPATPPKSKLGMAMKMGRPNNVMPMPDLKGKDMDDYMKDMGSMPGMDMSGMDMSDMDDDDDDDKNVQPTNVRNYTAMMTGGYDDMDLGSGGSLLLEDLGYMFGCGKDGIGYLLKMNNMGKTTLADHTNPANNYKKLVCKPIFFTYHNSDGKDPAPQNYADLNFLYQNKTRHLHSTPVYYNSAKNGHTLFVWGENEICKAYKVTETGIKWLGDGDIYASAQKVKPPGGMPGGMMSLAANGDKGGILVCSVPYGDANMTVTQGRLVVYDADNIVNGKLTKLWDSADWNIGFVYNKFMPPVVANGNIFLPNYNGGIDVYGLAGQAFLTPKG